MPDMDTRLSDMEVLVTGGAGFIGSHLSERLIDDGARVTVLDDLSTGSILNLDALKGREGFAYHIDTILNRPLMAELVDRADWVIHLAAAVGVQLVVEHPVRTIETCVHGTESVLEQAARKGKRTLIASSSEVYGKSERAPFREEDDMVFGPTTMSRWSYACSKAIDEFLALAHHAEHDLPVVIARFFNTVGPRQTGRYGMVLPRFVSSALAGRPIEIYGDGEQTRSFVHVQDTVEAIVSLMIDESISGEIFNVGSDKEITINELARRVSERAGNGSPVVHIPYDQAYAPGFEDLRRRAPSIEKLRGRIGYEPRHGLDQIIDSVIEYQKATHRD
jgi:UDP-glucose 4-epimerase